MNFTDRMIVLLRQDFRESDRMICAYTLEHGRIALRFPGVNKSDSKLKALSEPFSQSCARIYMRSNASIGCVTGGKIESVYPQIRKDAKKVEAAIYFCELFYRLTPDASPNPDKFLFLEESLQQLELSPLSPAVAPAFLLRLMQLSGFGLQGRPVLDIPAEFWEKMHTTPLSCLTFYTPQDIVSINKSRHVCQRFLNNYLNYPLNTISMLQMSAEVEAQQALAETALEPVLA